MLTVQGYTYDRVVQGNFVHNADRTWTGLRLKADRTRKGNKVLVTAGTVPGKDILDISWLQAASEAYDISPNIQDYVFAEMPGCQADLPNRNLDNFPYYELVKFRPILGQMTYRSFVGKLCVEGDALIDTEKGLVPIKDINKVGAKKALTPLGYRRIIEHFYNGIRSVVSIKLETGSYLKVTPDHEVQVLTENLDLIWKRADALVKGDYLINVVGAPTGPKNKVTLPPCPNKDDNVSRYEGKAMGGALNTREIDRVPSDVTPELARILGYLVAEGYINNKYFISFSNKRDDLIADYTYCWDTCFGRELTLNDKGNDNRELIDMSVLLREWFCMIGLNHVVSETQRVPWCILQSHPTIISNFLQAYWDGDGCHNTCFSKSPNLLIEIQQLLRRLGVMSTINGEILYIPYEDFCRFKLKIGTMREDREDEFNSTEWSRESAYNFIPFVGLNLGKIAENSRIGNGGSTRYKDASGKIRFMNLHVGHPNPNGRLTRKEVMDFMPALYLLDPSFAEKLEPLLNKRLRFVAVEEIEKSIDLPVCDLKIENAHQFLANGIVVHNCSQNHDNQEPKKAKGVIFDASLQNINGYWHVKVLTGWDRQKDPRLANRILKNQDEGYSMACLIEAARCSVCSYMAKGNITCRHVNGGTGKGSLWDGSQLVYEDMININFWEMSNVDDRADFDAVHDWSST